MVICVIAAFIIATYKLWLAGTQQLHLMYRDPTSIRFRFE